MKNWFETWFDSKFYHILYKNRDDSEAATFINALHNYLNFDAGSRVLDLACGSGRHSYQLAQLGYKTLGVDLAANSIKEARDKFIHKDLRFEVADMRDFSSPNSFDAILNLFTSFGYFENESDNAQVLTRVNENLVSGGIFVMDFMNAKKVVDSLVSAEVKTVDGIDFNITRKCDGNHIIKTIDFNAEGEQHSFMEKVQYLPKDTLVRLIEASGLNVKAIYGDYQLNSFEESIADRCIIVAYKN